jgi:ABC-type phosphate transport system substrate-binding protein
MFLVAGACLATLTLTVGSALADPNGAPTFRQLAGTASDTTQGVMNGLSDVILDRAGTKIIGSYDAATSSGQTISTKSTPACTNIPRPSGSGAGVTALINSQAAGDGCLQFARSSANDSASRTGANLTYIPFAVDAVSYAIRSDSAISKKLTLAQLTTIYNCGAGANFLPLLPQFGSGTRKFFLQKLGFTDAADFTSQPNHTCISQVDSNNNPLLENTGSLLTDPKSIAPYSIAQYLSQLNNVVPDVHGTTILGSINSVSPAVLNNSSVMVRDVYNVVPNSQLGVAPTSTTFVGSTSAICSNPNTIQRFGFGTNANCGDTSIHTP